MAPLPFTHMEHQPRVSDTSACSSLQPSRHLPVFPHASLCGSACLHRSANAMIKWQLQRLLLGISIFLGGKSTLKPWDACSTLLLTIFTLH